MTTVSRSIFSLLLLLPLSSAAISIWRSPANDERGLYARQIANRVGDLVTVEISESAQLSTTGTQTETEGQSSALQGEVIRLLENVRPGMLRLGRDENGDPIQLNLSSLLSGQYSGGEGSIQSQYSVARYPLTVQVTDRLPNGNLVIEGAKRVVIGGETAYAVLRGIIRERDIEDNNTISSSRVANATIEFYGEGALSDVQNKGWASRLFDSLNPF